MTRSPQHRHTAALPRRLRGRALWSTTLGLALAAFVGTACAPAEAARPMPWPPAWNEPAPQDPGSQGNNVDFSPVSFTAPSAKHCHRLPGTRQEQGDRQTWQGEAETADEADGPSRSLVAKAERRRAAVAEDKSGLAKSATAAESVAAPAPAFAPRKGQPVEQQAMQDSRPVTAGVVDDNADFGEYQAYRRRHPVAPQVLDRDISERYLLEVTDARGRPVHDAEVAVQRAGVAEPVMWARTDTAGRVWLHPRAFLPPETQAQSLGVAVRKAGVQARATLMRGQPQSVQVRLDDARWPAVAQARPRLDLVFMVDATGSMGDEIAKLKSSMRAMAQQISQLPGQPDICYGLVAYRDRGDAFVTRTHDLTDNLDAFQAVLSQVQAAGGGDTPEAMGEALSEVVHRLDWRTDAARMVVMVADAPPQTGAGRPPYDREMQAALAKGIKLFAVGASGLDPVGEYTFRQMAQYTAGRFVFLTYRDAANPGSGPGTQTVHDVKQYSVQTLDRLVVRLVKEEMERLKAG